MQEEREHLKKKMFLCKNPSFTEESWVEFCLSETTSEEDLSQYILITERLLEANFVLQIARTPRYHAQHGRYVCLMCHSLDLDEIPTFATLQEAQFAASSTATNYPPISYIGRIGDDIVHYLNAPSVANVDNLLCISSYVNSNHSMPFYSDIGMGASSAKYMNGNETIFFVGNDLPALAS